MPVLPRTRRWPVPLLTIAALLAATAGPATADTHHTPHRAAPPGPDLGAPAAVAEIADLPKGGDLHHHLRGAVGTDTVIGWAIEDQRCRKETDKGVWMALSQTAPCPIGTQQITEADRGKLLKDWSMRAFNYPDDDPNAGHDHFFQAPILYGNAIKNREADILAEVARTAAEEKVTYIETLLGSQQTALETFIKNQGLSTVTADQIPAAFGWIFNNQEFQNIVDTAVTDFENTFLTYRDAGHLNCAHTTPRPPACDVVIRFDYQASRGKSSGNVFAQLILGAQLTGNSRSRVVGVNLVGPEDGKIALRDYQLHMTMVGFIKHQLLNSRFTLHAGELVPNLNGVINYKKSFPQAPDPTTFHVKAAVDAGAERIGHAVDLYDETNHADTITTMRANHILIEVPLSSNDSILRKTGLDHPVRKWIADGVPVALSSDDPGITNSTLGNEFQLAYSVVGITIDQLKTMARASLDHAFVEGHSIWRQHDHYTQDNVIDECKKTPLGTPWNELRGRCLTYLDESPRAALQWQLEIELVAFAQHLA